MHKEQNQGQKGHLGTFNHPDTACVQAGYHPESGAPRITPIVQSTTFQYDSSEAVAALFDLAAEGHMYSRISNPTVSVLEETLAELEGGVGALCVSSGQAATLLSILTICEAGDELIAFRNLYGGTFTLLGATLKKFGITTRFVDLGDTDAAIAAYIVPQTKLIFGETIGNPGTDVLDIERFAALAHAHGLPLFVDNTLATPYLCRPLDWGADVVVHSTTKYLDGHATSIGGAIVDGGSFDWHSGRFPQITEPDPNYHGLSYTEAFGNQAYITRARAVFLRDLGATMSPMNAFLTKLGSQTLHLRMERHSANALAVAQFLERHPAVAWVKYPFLETSASRARAEKYLKGGSGILVFGVHGGYAGAQRLIDSLKLTSLVVHLGDIRTHALHPASMTHRQLSEADQRRAGILPEMIRLSVGIEHIEDILRDLKDALEGANHATDTAR